MKRSYLSALAVAVAALAAGQAVAADASAPKTRAEVKAELAEAIRTGENFVQVGDSTMKANEAFPHLYPAKPEVAGKTREQVQAELKEAIRQGQMPVYIGS